MTTPSLPTLNPFLRFVQKPEKSHDFNKTYSEIEKLLKDSKKQISALNHAESAAAVVNQHHTSPNHNNSGATATAGLRHSHEWNKTKKRKHYLTRAVPAASGGESHHGMMDGEVSPFDKFTHSASLVHLPINLRHEVAKYKHDVSEYLELEKRVKERKRELKRRKQTRKKEETFTTNLVVKNIEHVETRDELLRQNLHKMARNLPEVRRREKSLANTRKEHIQDQIDKKNQWMEYLTEFSSPKDREKYVYGKERHRQLWILVVLSRFVSPLESALFEHRIKNGCNLTNNPPTSERQLCLFNMHKRRLFMEIRRREQNPLDLNPFVAHLKYRINRQWAAAQMIRNFSLQVAESKMTVDTIKQYLLRIRQCQRYVKNYLVCKKARLLVMRLQLEKYQKEQQRLKKLRMAQKLNTLSTTREHIMDRKKRIVRLKEKMSDPALFFDFPDLVTNKLLREHLSARTRRHIAMLIKMKSLQRVQKPATTRNFTMFSKFIKTKAQKPAYMPTPKFSSLLTQEELKEVYQECISQTMMLSDANMIVLMHNGVVIRKVGNKVNPNKTSPQKSRRQQAKGQNPLSPKKKRTNKKNLSLSQLEEDNNISLLLQKLRERANAANYNQFISKTQKDHRSSDTFLTSVELTSDDSRSTIADVLPDDD